MPLFGPPNVEKLRLRKDVPGLIKAVGYKRNPMVRMLAADALAEIGDERAVRPLAGALGFYAFRTLPCEARRYMAALGSLVRAASGEVVYSLGLKIEKHSRIAAAAAAALGRIGGDHAAEELLRHMPDHPTGEPLAEALTSALREACATCETKVLLRIVHCCGASYSSDRDEAPELVEAALDALAAAGAIDEIRHGVAPVSAYTFSRLLDRMGGAALDCLEDIAGSDGSTFHEEAARALGRIGQMRAARSLTGALTKESASVRRSAARALEALDWLPDSAATEAAWRVALRDWDGCADVGREAIVPLTGARDDEQLDEEVRQGAAWALGRIACRPSWEESSAELGSDEPGRRVRAAKHLGRCADERAVEPLVAAMADAHASVRAAGAVAMGRLGDGRAVQPLLEAMGDEAWQVREAAARALGRLRDARAAPALTGALLDPNDAVRRAAAAGVDTLDVSHDIADERARAFFWVLRRQLDRAVALGRVAVEAIGEELRYAHAPRRAAAMRRAATIDETEDRDELLAGEDWLSVEPMVRAAAAGALGRLAGDSHTPLLLEMLGDDIARVRAAAAEALGRTGDRTAAGALAGALGDWSMRVRFAALDALEAFGWRADEAEPDVQARWAAVRDEREGLGGAEMRASRQIDPWCEALVAALVRIGDPRAIEYMVDRLRADETTATGLAIFPGLGNFRRPEAVDALLRYGLSGRSVGQEERLAATEALGWLGDARATEALIYVARYGGSDGELAGAVVEALGKLGADAVDPLIEALSQEDKSSRGEGQLRKSYWARALGEIGSARAVEALVAVIEGPVYACKHTPAMRSAAAEALGKIGDPRAVAPLAATTQTTYKSYDNRAERVAAIEALGRIGNAEAVDAVVSVAGRRDLADAAASALARIGGDQAVARLMTDARSGGSDDQDRGFGGLYALWAEGRLTDRQKRDVLAVKVG